MSEKNNNQEESGLTVSSRLLGLLILGFLLVFAGVIVLVVALLFSGASASVGGVIFIGPIPIVFGAGPDAMWLILVSIIMTVAILLLMVFKRRGRMWV